MRHHLAVHVQLGRPGLGLRCRRCTFSLALRRCLGPAAAASAPPRDVNGGGPRRQPAGRVASRRAWARARRRWARNQSAARRPSLGPSTGLARTPRRAARARRVRAIGSAAACLRTRESLCRGRRLVREDQVQHVRAPIRAGQLAKLGARGGQHAAHSAPCRLGWLPPWRGLRAEGHVGGKLVRRLLRCVGRSCHTRL
jgi:hypothetical protein